MRAWCLRASEGLAGWWGAGVGVCGRGEELAASRWRPGKGPAGRPAGSPSDAHSSLERKESERHGVRTAEKLLREFYPQSASGQTQLRLLQSLCLLATREKANVEAALGTFIDMAQAEVRGLPGREGGLRGGAEGGPDATTPASHPRRRTASPPCWPWRRPTRC